MPARPLEADSRFLPEKLTLLKGELFFAFSHPGFDSVSVLRRTYSGNYLLFCSGLHKTKVFTAPQSVC